MGGALGLLLGCPRHYHPPRPVDGTSLHSSVFQADPHLQSEQNPHFPPRDLGTFLTLLLKIF